VIFGADASLFVPEDGAEARKAARRDIDAYNCYSQRFCLYGCWNWDQAGPCGGRLQFGASYAGQGWFNLGDVGRNDWVYSMRNRRDNDSLLARDNNGNGTKWCGQQHSVDSNLADEPIGSQSASSFRLTQIPNHC
jgi:hypothetical protein